MTALDLLSELKTRGVILRLEQDRLRYAPLDLVTPVLLEAMRQRRSDLVHFVQERKICELLHRYHLGRFTPDVRARLERIFADDPPDAWQRLLQACDHLEITGEQLEELAAEVTQKERELN